MMKIPESSRTGLPADLIGWLAVLMLFQLAGETLSRGFNLPVPGPVIGLAGLVLALAFIPSAPRSLEATANGLLSRLAVMFVPAGVGVVQNLGLLADHAFALITALVLSTAIGMTATAFVFSMLNRLHNKHFIS
jgi:holin-like protein